MIATCSVVWLVALGGTLGADLNPLQVEQRVLEARRAITHGRMTLHCVPEGESEAEAVDVSLWFDYRSGRRQQWDYRMQPPDIMHVVVGDLSLADPQAKHVEILVRDGGKRIWWSPNKYDKPLPPLAVSIKYGESAPQDTMEFDPLVIGLTVDGFSNYWQSNPKSILTRVDRTEEKVEKREVEGREVIVSEYRRGDGARVSLWISPAEGNSLIRATTTHREGKDEFRTEAQFHVARVSTPTGDVWFPDSAAVTRFEGGRSYGTERLTISDVSLNGDLDESVFSLAGMAIPAGTPVLEVPQTSGDQLTWDGKTIVAEKDPHRVDLLPVAPPTDGRARWMLLLGLNLALVAAVLFVLWMRSRPNGHG